MELRSFTSPSRVEESAQVVLLVEATGPWAQYNLSPLHSYSRYNTHCCNFLPAATHPEYFKDRVWRSVAPSLGPQSFLRHERDENHAGTLTSSEEKKQKNVFEHHNR